MLKCEHLVKKYITTTAISDLSLEIEPGHIYALLGPNGSGKSTLMKIIAGLVKPDSGTITIDGVPMTYRSKKDIAYMPTEAFFFGYMKKMYTHNVLTKMSYLAMKDQLREMKHNFDASEYGGAPLLGLQKPVIKAHGSSDAKAIMNAVRQAEAFVKTGVIEEITQSLESIRENNTPAK